MWTLWPELTGEEQLHVVAVRDFTGLPPERTVTLDGHAPADIVMTKQEPPLDQRIGTSMIDTPETFAFSVGGKTCLLSIEASYTDVKYTLT